MKQEFVTLPREVVERALASLESEFGKHSKSASDIRAALKQPKNHVPDAGNMVPVGWRLVPVEPTREMIEAGKDAHYEAEKRIQEPDAWEQGGFAKRAVRAAHVFQAMLASAPQPPTTEESSVVQPQAEQPAMTPIAQRKLDSLLAEGYTISGYSVYHERKHQHGFVTGAGLVGWWRPEGVEYPQPLGEQEPGAWYVERHAPGRRDHGMKLGPFWKRKDAEEWLDDNHRLRSLYAGQPPQGGQDPVAEIQVKNGHWIDTPVARTAHLVDGVYKLYTHPQPKREPLTDEQVDAIADAMPGGLEGFMNGWGWRQFARAVIEATHNIK